MNKTKQKIIEHALQLFNEYGYSQVTIRMIASNMGISSGNLNYHFKKREAILEHLYFEMVSDFDKRIEVLSDVKISFDQIKYDIKTSMERMIKYKFIWTDLFNLLKSNDEIRGHFNGVYEKRISGCLFLFDQLHKMKLMRSADFKIEYVLLAERMVSFGDTWIYSSSLHSKKNTKKHIEHQVITMLAMIYPYLSKKGISEYEKSFPNWFI